MSVDNYLQIMPKAELYVHLEGAVSPETMLIIADQNEVSEEIKHFDTWATLLKQPEFDRLEETVRMAATWVRLPEDLTRIAYDAGTALARQQIRYAEITVNPALYTQINLTLDQFFAAINDGRERAERAWGIRIGWVLGVPREEPRRADEYARWASSVPGRKASVVALGLVGKESAQPVGQFERAFASAEKKDFTRVARAGDVYGAEGVMKAVEVLAPNRIAEAWGAAESEDVLNLVRQQNITLDLSMARAVVSGAVTGYSEYPLRKLYDDDIRLTLNSDMPAYFKTTLTEQYRLAVHELGFSVDEVEDIALNAVRASGLDDDARQAMIGSFTDAYETLRGENLTEETPQS